MTRLTLTFDNGPTPGITDHVLDVLNHFGVKTTFFLVGSRLCVPAARALAERAHRDGHWIGNHSMTHGTPLAERPDAHTALREIADMDALLGSLCHPDRLFRPNGRGKIGPHLLSAAARDYLLRSRGTMVLWTHVPQDRHGPADAWVADARRPFAEMDWPLLVLHDRPSGHDVPAGSMSYLEAYLEWALRSGIEIVQEFPDSCVPIRRGQVCMPLDPYVHGAASPT